MKKNNYLKRCGWLYGCILSVATFSACSDDSTDSAIPDFTPGTDFTENITALPEAGSQSLKFTAGTNWTAQSNQAWLKLNGKTSITGTAGASQINMTYEENTDVNDRPAIITLTAGSTTKTINVSQKAAGRVIAFKTATSDTLKLAKDMKAFNAEIIANVDWEYVADSLGADDSKWIGITVSDGKVAIAISNQDGLNRCARLVFRDKNFTSFTKALFVHVEGWGEEHLEWELSKASFDTAGGKAVISATYVPEAAPRAFESDANGNIADATKAEWITFADKPAPQSVLQDKEWEMTVGKNNTMDARFAIVLVVPTSMTDAQVIEQQAALAKKTVLQSGETEPRLTFTLFHYVDTVWTNAGVVSEWTFANNSMAPATNSTLSINTNCSVSAPRVVILDAQGNESAPILVGPGANQFITSCKFRSESTTYIDLSMSAGTTFIAARGINWVAVDLMNGNIKLKTVYFKATIKSYMEPKVS